MLRDTDTTARASLFSFMRKKRCEIRLCRLSFPRSHDPPTNHNRAALGQTSQNGTQPPRPIANDGSASSTQTSGDPRERPDLWSPVTRFLHLLPCCSFRNIWYKANGAWSLETGWTAARCSWKGHAYTFLFLGKSFELLHPDCLISIQSEQLPASFLYKTACLM